MELPNIAAYAYRDVHVWSALLTCLRPPRQLEKYTPVNNHPHHPHTDARVQEVQSVRPNDASSGCTHQETPAHKFLVRIDGISSPPPPPPALMRPQAQQATADQVQWKGEEGSWPLTQTQTQTQTQTLTQRTQSGTLN